MEERSTNTLLIHSFSTVSVCLLCI